MIPSCWIYLYHLDRIFNIPVTPESIPNSYQSKFSIESIMNRTAPKVTYSGSGPRNVNVDLSIHTQLYALDNPDYPNIDKDLVKALISCAYPSFDNANSEIVPPSILMKFGETTTIRGVINGGVTCNFSGPWLKDGTMAMAHVQFSVTETDQYSAEYISSYGSSPSYTIPTNLQRNNSMSSGTS